MAKPARLGQGLAGRGGCILEIDIRLGLQTR